MRIMSYTYSPRSPSGHTHAVGRWYWPAGLLVAGFVAAAVWVVGAVIGLSDHVDQFPRTDVPGEISAPIGSPDTYYVYYEGATDTTLDRLGVTVIDPTGEPVTVRPVDEWRVVRLGRSNGRPCGGRVPSFDHRRLQPGGDGRFGWRNDRPRRRPD